MIEKFFEFLDESLAELKDKGLYRGIRDREYSSNMIIKIDGKNYINFASNDYLGLTHHPLVIEAAKKSLELFGTGAGASRLLSGGTILYKNLEELLCKIKGTPRALLLNSGYTANTTVIPCLMEEEDLILSDELNHASIIDGCRLSKAKRIIFPHKDMDALEKLIKSNRRSSGKLMIVTDSVFSMDGDIAPLRDIYILCKKYEALLYVDDAHGTGVLGNGSGALKHFDIPSESFILQMGTLSKAIGSFGAFVSGNEILIDWIINKGRGFIFSTALPPAVVGAAYASLKIIEEEKSLIEKLWNNTKIVFEFLKKLKFQMTNTETPIIPVIFNNIEEAQKASDTLLRYGIYAPVIKPPTVKNVRIRITISAAHSEKDLETLKEAFIHLYQQLRQV